MQTPKVLFENDYLLVIDKPAGFIVNEAATTGDTPVLQSWISQNFNFEIAKSQEFRSGIVHRLDKETSGILLIAKTEQAFYNLQKQFKNRVVKKTYLALTHGIVMPENGELKATVGRLPWRRDRFGVIPGGREAITNYRLIAKYQLSNSEEKFSLVEFYPQTGRTHQIRIHAKYLGHPIVSDEFYAGRKTSRKDRKWCPRLFLHASSISFNDPVTNVVKSFKTDLPQELETAIRLLTKFK